MIAACKEIGAISAPRGAVKKLTESPRRRYLRPPLSDAGSAGIFAVVRTSTLPSEGYDSPFPSRFFDPLEILLLLLRR